MPDEPCNLNGKLIVGNIIQLNEILKSNPDLKKNLKDGFGQGGIDLVSGGPPCQSFSLAGLRNKNCHKNNLPWEFAKFVEHVKPKVVLLENVTGILRPFKEDEEHYYAWFEIAKTFAAKGYIPLCIHVNARYAGVPQNRPRFIMMGVRDDIYERLKQHLNETETKLFAQGEKLFCAIQKGQKVAYGSYPCFDAQKKNDHHLFEKSFLHFLIGKKEITVMEAIGDLKYNTREKKSQFVVDLNASFASMLGDARTPSNHDGRQHTPKVKRRFRIYQIIQQCGSEVRKEVTAFLKEQREDISEKAWGQLKTYAFLLGDDEYVKFRKKDDLLSHLSRHGTKKQTQKALCATMPAPAALSIPDDTCHYDQGELRTLTAREMARIQSFPDNFKFRSKLDTGGKMRRFEVPQYTQIGNAVPPLLGLALGKAVKTLLGKL